MSEPALEDAVLAYLARDDSDEPEFQSLTTIYEFAPLKNFRAAFSRAEEGIGDKDQVEKALNQLVADGMVEDKQDVGNYESSYRVTQDGFYQSVLGNEALIPVTTDDPLPKIPISVDSSAWTGRRLTENELTELVRIIDNAVEAIESLHLPQSKIAQARSYLLAARALSEAPEPPINVISWLLANFDRSVGIAGLLVGVASLVSSWTK